MPPVAIGLDALALAAAGTVWWLATVVDGRALPGLDRDAMSAARDLRTGGLEAVAKVVTALGSSIAMLVLLAVAIGWLLRARRAAEAAALGLGGAAVLAAVHLVKAGTDRPRPASPLVETTLSSFPSGHAAYAVAFVAVAAVLARGARPRRAIAARAAAVLLAVAVGLTRVYLRAHFATDVLAGWGLGIACFAAPAAAAALAVGRVGHNGRPS